MLLDLEDKTLDQLAVMFSKHHRNAAHGLGFRSVFDTNCFEERVCLSSLQTMYLNCHTLKQEPKTDAIRKIHVKVLLLSDRAVNMNTYK